MPGRISTVTKGSFCAAADAMFREPTPELLAAYESDTRSATAISIDEGAIRDDAGAGQNAHSNEFYGTGDDDFFPDLPESMKRETVRGVYVQAMRLAIYTDYDARTMRSTPKPIVTYWIAVDEAAFEAYVADSEHEVTVFLMTPTPKPAMTPPAPPHDRNEALWLVAEQARVQEINSRIPASYNPEPAVELRSNGGVTVLSQRLKGY